MVNTCESTLLFYRSYTKCKTVIAGMPVMSSSSITALGGLLSKPPGTDSCMPLVPDTPLRILSSPKVPIYKEAATEEISN